MSDTQPLNPMLARASTPTASAAPSSRSGSASGAAPLLPPDAEPDAVVDEILSLLSGNRFLTARELAVQAAARFPDHARIGRLKYALNDAKSRVGSGGPQPNTTEEFNWLRNPPRWAQGKWVALVGTEVVAAADTLEEVRESLRSRTFAKKPLVHRID